MAFRASWAFLQQNIRWAFSWSTPKAPTFRKGTANTATQNVNLKASVTPRSKLSQCVLPSCAARSIHPPPRCIQAQIKVISPPMAKRKNCITSVHITVRIPPIKVQPIAKTPIKRMHTSNEKGVTIMRGIAATSTRTLWARIDPIVKKTVARAFSCGLILRPM